MLSPLRSDSKADSKAIVAHAARVQASAGPMVTLSPDAVNEPPHWLQSALAEARLPSTVSV